MVKLFAQVRHAAGTDEIHLDLDDGAVASDVLAALAARVPALEPCLVAARVAINRAFCNRDTPVRTGDEVAIIPPVSGG